MAVKKSELYSSIWASCDELRGGMDASQYKDYVLTLLFIKYVSDKYTGVPYAPIIIPEGASFKDMVALKGKPSIGDDINKKIIAKIAKENNLTGTIDIADFNDSDKLGGGKEMVDRLTRLVAIFESPALDFSKNRAEGDDLLGDAYEYLMRNFATESGKSKGQFYTPAEVSRVMAKIIMADTKANPSTTVYDPTCGSGSLLLKVADETEKGLSIYGQEREVSNAALARMNMILHDNPTAVIERGNTLSNPLFLDGNDRMRTFDFVVANPPFSYKSWSNGLDPLNEIHGRFKDFGIPPNKNGDYSFLLHVIRSMKSKAKGAIILPHGVLFRGNSEAGIRENIIRRGYIKGIIGLPANLFYGTGIPACIIILDKENAHNRKGIFMINASDGYVKDGNKNRLREQDIHRIVDMFNKQIEIEKYSRMVSIDEIEKNDYNLNIPRYIDSQEAEDIQDIEAHLLGGIPNADIDALCAWWDVYPSLKKELFSPTDRPKYSKLKVESDQIKQTIFSHPEFTAYGEKVYEILNRWKQINVPLLKGLKKDDKPKKLIYDISESLLDLFSGLSLLDKYDVYQNLMTYWADTMQDDVYAIVDGGWQVGREIEKDPKKKNEWQGRVIPKQLVMDRYFAQEQKDIEILETERENLTRQLEELEEEHSGDEGLLEEAKNDKGTLTKSNVQKRIREIKNEKNSAEELTVLKQYLNLLEQIAEARQKIKKAVADLEKKVLEKYKDLTIDEIQTLVLDDKWLVHIEQDIQSEMQRISQHLTGRIQQLAERYDKPLSTLENNVNDLEEKGKYSPDENGIYMEMKERYKQTELGIFPEDWSVRSLGEIGVFSKGQGVRKDEALSGENPCIRYGEIYTRHNDYIKEFYSFISKAVSQTAKKLKKGDILFAGSGETKEEIGKCVAFIDDFDAFAGGDIVILSPKNISPLFLGFLLNSNDIQKQKASKGQGDAVVHINANQLSSVKIPLPTTAEQTAIATALSETDALIHSLEKLIAKKRAIKQGAMQELLTGKKRLRGFGILNGELVGYKETEVGVVPADWKVISVNDITVNHRQGYYTKDKYSDEGTYLIRITDLLNPRINYSDMPKLNINKNDFELYKVKKGDFLFARSGAIGRYGIVYNDMKAVFGSYIIRFTFDLSKIFNEYFGFLYETELIRKQLLSITQGSSNININANNIKSIKIPLPTIEEQTAIAKILSDMDTEIEALEKKLEKYRLIKQGMMQNLLTGRIRLV